MSTDQTPATNPTDETAEEPIVVPQLDLTLPEPGSEEARASAIMEAVLPLFLDAGRARMENDPSADERIAMLLESLRVSAAELGEDTDGFWSSAAQVVDAVLVAREKPMTLVHRTEALDKRDGFAWKTLCVLCYVGASMQPDVEPRMAVMLHMAVAEYVYNHTTHYPVLYEQAVLPWFVAYWLKLFEIARFKFYTPKFVEPDLREAAVSPEPIRLQRILRAAAFGLWEPIPEKARAWFDLANEYKGA